MTLRHLILGLLYAAVAAAGFALGSRRAAERRELERQATQERQGEVQTSREASQARDEVTRSQERQGEREETRQPDGTVRVVTRWRTRDAEVKVVEKRVEVEVEKLVWRDRVEWKEKLVEVKPAPAPWLAAGLEASRDLDRRLTLVGPTVEVDLGPVRVGVAAEWSDVGLAPDQVSVRALWRF